MTSEHEDTRVVRILLEGQKAVRETAFRNIATTARKASNVLNDLGADAGFIASDGGIGVLNDHLATLAQYFESIVGYSHQIADANVTIKNIETLSRGRFSVSDPPKPKAATNVTQLQRSVTTQTTGSAKATRALQGADNPGRERQRKRKQSQDDGGTLSVPGGDGTTATPVDRQEGDSGS